MMIRYSVNRQTGHSHLFPINSDQLHGYRRSLELHWTVDQTSHFIWELAHERQLACKPLPGSQLLSHTERDRVWCSFQSNLPHNWFNQMVSKSCNHGEFSDMKCLFHIQSAIQQKTISDLLKSETCYLAEVLWRNHHTASWAITVSLWIQSFSIKTVKTADNLKLLNFWSASGDCITTTKNQKYFTN